MLVVFGSQNMCLVRLVISLHVVILVSNWLRACFKPSYKPWPMMLRNSELAGDFTTRTRTYVLGYTASRLAVFSECFNEMIYELHAISTCVRSL